jgi:hypothetical protein
MEDYRTEFLERAAADITSWESLFLNGGYEPRQKSTLADAMFQLDWLLSSDEGGGTSFIDICDSLDVDPEVIRSEMLAAVDRSALVALMSKLHQENNRLIDEAEKLMRFKWFELPRDVRGAINRKLGNKGKATLPNPDKRPFKAKKPVRKK